MSFQPAVVSQDTEAKAADIGDLRDIKKRLERLKAKSGGV